MAFLSLLDPRAKPKGSRDPLGFELIWTHYGRHVIGNLTTITTSLDNFVVALLGFHWANEIHANASASERWSRVMEMFLRYEQMAGYLRYMGGGGEILGITRISKRMSDGSDRIGFGTGAGEQILGDQVNYGLWGFYANPMRDSGLIEGDDRRPTAEGRAIAARFEQHLDKDALRRLYTANRAVKRRELEQHAAPFVAAIGVREAREQLLALLMQGGEKNAVQQEIWRITRTLAENNRLPDGVPAFVAALKAETADSELQARLEAIESVERLLVAANNLFHYCRRKDGEAFRSVLDHLDGRYDYGHIPEDVDLAHAPARGALLNAIRTALRGNDVETALRRILDLNRQVMADRNGAPWVEIETGGTLRVRVPSETAELRRPEELKTAWDYEYFMSSYLAIARQALQ